MKVAQALPTGAVQLVFNDYFYYRTEFRVSFDHYRRIVTCEPKLWTFIIVLLKDQLMCDNYYVTLLYYNNDSDLRDSAKRLGTVA